MKISVSYLSVIDDLKEKIKMIDKTDCDYIHLDIMDGVFVFNKTPEFDEIKDNFIGINKKLDVHLMCKDIKKYIDQYALLNPDYITFHIECATDVLEIINYIKSKNIKAGITFKPDTSIDTIKPYLKYIDLVLVMSVEPGLGGQKFISKSINKINNLHKLRNDLSLSYKIEVDGGINLKTISFCDKADIAVVGSYITSSNNYQIQIDKLRGDAYNE